LEGEKTSSSILKDLQWLTHQGEEFPHDAWQSGTGRDLFYAMGSDQQILLILMNANDTSCEFTSPSSLCDLNLEPYQWSLVIDTAYAHVEDSPWYDINLGPQKTIEILDKSVQVWKIDLD
jgi:pullulanase/glycogen debranching enzyme